MPLRRLTLIERQGLKRLSAQSIDVTLIQPTKTGLQKSILDATAPVRNFLFDRGIHDYSVQGLGASQHGVRVEATLLGVDFAIQSWASLYRPKTKKGDPRVWITKLPEYAEPDDILAITAYERRLFVINLTRIDISTVLDNGISGPLSEILQRIAAEEQVIAQELLAKLRKIAAKGFIPSAMEARADTAVGRTLETALGIPINSDRAPDYKGIELKSYRRRSGSRANRKTLFAQVPDWSISWFKSSREILDAFGYRRGDDFKLYCTVSTLTKNSRGLYFELEDESGLLKEVSDNKDYGPFAAWYLADLKNRLAEKHNETFWVSAEVQVIEGLDYFKFHDVIHTRRPISSQFDILLEQGEITMDHLIKRDRNGRVSEKGPLFRIKSTSLELLFPPSQSYRLLD